MNIYPPMSYSLEDWVEYKNFISAEVSNVAPTYERALVIKREKEEKKKKNLEAIKETGSFSWSFFGTPIKPNNTNICNINGIGCKKNQLGSITYNDSDFNRLSSYIKLYYRNSLDLFLSNNVAELKRFPSFTQIFQPNEHIQFLPYYLIFDNILNYIGDERSPVYLHDLYNGNYDEVIYKYIDELSTNLALQHVAYIHSITIDEIIEGTRNTVLCSLNQIYNSENNTQYHTIASVFWRDPDSTNIVCCVYDPMYYSRNDNKNYFFPLIAFYINMKFLAKMKGVNIQIINLSNFCYESDKGIHCPQYVIDAEYCNIYAIYFIYSYILRGYPRDEDGLRQVIRDCFIVEPTELTRAISIPNNIFRVTMMSFILTVLLLITVNPLFSAVRRTPHVREQIVQMAETHRRVKAAGFDLLQPKLEFVLHQLVGGTGGRRKTCRRRRQMKRTRKTRASKK